MERQSLNRVLIGAGLALAVAGGGIYWWQNRAPEPPPVVEEPLEAPVSPMVELEPAIEHPLAEADPTDGATALPPIEESDTPLTAELGVLFGADALTSYLEPQSVARRIVATIDGMPRAHGADRLRPVKPLVPGFAVERRPPTSPTAEERIFVAEDNAARYTPLVSLVEMVDLPATVALYRRWYPMLQKSYEDLGYPGRYFNDRLVTVIDHLLETPNVKGQIELVQPNVLFEYADPQLEALSSGQKLLLRMGPDNSRRVQARLKELRTLVTAPASAPPTQK